MHKVLKNILRELENRPNNISEAELRKIEFIWEDDRDTLIRELKEYLSK